MRKLVSGFLLACLVVPTVGLAKEPTNIHVIKQQLIRYHDSGEYNRDIKAVINNAMRYLTIRLSRPFPLNKKPAIVLDIDETSLSNYNDMLNLGFGGTIEQIRADEDKAQDPAIKPTLQLFEFAKAHHVAVFFITGRHDFEREPTEANLKNAGFKDWDGLILRHGEYHKAPAAVYKIAMRKEITEKGYDIILNIGDQKSDLTGGYTDKGFKLPNPYYFIP